MYPFPSINQFRNVVKTVREQACYMGKNARGEAVFNPAPIYPKMSFTGTVKLHGTNAVEIAIGYLSSWGLSYPFVDIYINVRDTEFTACYRKRAFEEGDSPAYVIGAVFNKQSKKFGFHS